MLILKLNNKDNKNLRKFSEEQDMRKKMTVVCKYCEREKKVQVNFVENIYRDLKLEAKKKTLREPGSEKKIIGCKETEEKTL